MCSSNLEARVTILENAVAKLLQEKGDVEQAAICPGSGKDTYRCTNDGQPSRICEYSDCRFRTNKYQAPPHTYQPKPKEED